MKRLTLSIACLLITINTFSQQHEMSFKWTFQSYLSKLQGQFAFSITNDDEGNFYELISSNTDSIFQSNVVLTKSTSNIYHALYLLKYNASGNLLWHHKIGKLDPYISGYGIVSHRGRIYVHGTFQFGIMDFGNGNILLPNIDDAQSFLVEYDGNGTFIKARKFNYVNLNHLSSNNKDKLYATFQHASIDSVVTIGDTTFTNGKTNFLLTVLDSRFTPVYVKAVPVMMNTLPAGDRLYTYRTQRTYEPLKGTIMFDDIPFKANDTLGKWGSFVTRINLSTNKFDALFKIPEIFLYESDFTHKSISINKSSGNVIFLGSFKDSMRLGTQLFTTNLDRKHFVASLKPDLSLNWMKSFSEGSGTASNVFSRGDSILIIGSCRKINFAYDGIIYEPDFNKINGFDLNLKFSILLDSNGSMKKIWPFYTHNFTECAWLDNHTIVGLPGSFPAEGITINGTTYTQGKPRYVGSSLNSCFQMSQYTVGLSATTVGSMKLYPNPASAMVYFRDLKGNGNKVEVYTVRGQLMKSRSIESQEGIDISDLVNGIYFVRLNNGTSYHIEKLIISR